MKPLPKNKPLDSGPARHKALIKAATEEMGLLRGASFRRDKEQLLLADDSFEVCGLPFVRIDTSHYVEGLSREVKAAILAVPNRNDDLHRWADTLETHSNPVVQVDYPYFMSTTIVNNRLFGAFMADTGYRTLVSRLATGWTVDKDAQWTQGMANEWDRQPHPMSAPDHPVTQLSWFDAMQFAAWLGARAGIAMRLPTQEEWTLAARPERLRDQVCAFPWGNDLDGIDARMNFGTAELCEHMWVHDQYRDGHAYTSPVTAYPANERGLYDMCGNVWVWNHAGGSARHEKPHAGRVATVPDVGNLGADRNEHIAMQGGCYLARLTHANLVSRMSHPATDGACDIGFRLVAVRATESGGVLG
jgi:formylglycine-generating enzyme